MSISKNIENLKNSLPSNVTLVAVTKTHSPQVIMEAYNAGHKVFGENRVQEMVPKHEELPKDIHWHLIGHLQTNKVKYIAPFVSFIHSVDSLRLLTEINKQAKRHDRVIPCLLQMHIAEEDTKFGMSQEELDELLNAPTLKDLENIEIRGLMGMSTFTDDKEQVRREFKGLASIFVKTKETHFQDDVNFSVLSMGMSGDYHIAIEEGSTMIRVGSVIFGER